MARFDDASGEIVLRIVFDGPATAGKSTTLRSIRDAFASRARGDIFVPEQSSTGRTLFFDWLELRVGHVDDVPARAELLTVPGQLSFAERRLRLLSSADAVVFVCESTPRAALAARVAWRFFASARERFSGPFVSGVFVANKQDLEGALSPAEVAARVGWDAGPAVGASALDPDGSRAAVIRALDLARARTRALLAGAHPRTLSPVETPAELYEAMRGTDDKDPGLEEAIEIALAEFTRSAAEPHVDD